jgi:dTDP-4-amino-4,6-dideoxygalactose transaminase
MTTATLTPTGVDRYELASTTWDQAEYDAMQRVIATGQFTMGKTVGAFEAAFADTVGSQYAVMVNSGSSANLLMVAALMYRKEGALQPGDEVIVPAVSWPTTYYPLAQYGLKLKFVDIDPLTLNYDLAALKAAVTDHTRCLMVVNLLGNPNDFDQLKAIIGPRNIVMIEDNCESLGSCYNGKQGGTFGLMGSYSSFFSHHISTMEGGLIATDDEELYHILLCLRSHGWTRNLPIENKVCGTKSDNAFEEAFRFILPGYNVRPGEIHAAIGIEQLKKLPDIIRVRRENAAYFVSRFANHDLFDIQQEIGESSWFGFSFVIKPHVTGLTRAKVIARLEAARIDCRPIVAGNFAKNEVCKHFDYTVHGGSLPYATRIDERGFFVGNHHYPIQDKIDYLSAHLSPDRM